MSIHSTAKNDAEEPFSIDEDEVQLVINIQAGTGRHLRGHEAAIIGNVDL
jgi:hypothetical protein